MAAGSPSWKRLKRSRRERRDEHGKPGRLVRHRRRCGGAALFHAPPGLGAAAGFGRRAAAGLVGARDGGPDHGRHPAADGAEHGQQHLHRRLGRGDAGSAHRGGARRDRRRARKRAPAALAAGNPAGTAARRRLGAGAGDAGRELGRAAAVLGPLRRLVLPLLRLVHAGVQRGADHGQPAVRGLRGCIRLDRGVRRLLLGGALADAVAGDDPAGRADRGQHLVSQRPPVEPLLRVLPDRRGAAADADGAAAEDGRMARGGVALSGMDLALVPGRGADRDHRDPLAFARRAAAG